MLLFRGSFCSGTSTRTPPSCNHRNSFEARAPAPGCSETSSLVCFVMLKTHVLERFYCSSSLFSLLPLNCRRSPSVQPNLSAPSGSREGPRDRGRSTWRLEKVRGRRSVGSTLGGLGPRSNRSHWARGLGTRTPRRDRKPCAHTLFLDAAKGPANVMGGEYERLLGRGCGPRYLETPS